jgi:hypothetical protein
MHFGGVAGCAFEVTNVKVGVSFLEVRETGVSEGLVKIER